MSSIPGGNIVVVDTNVISFFLKRDTRAVLYESHLIGNLRIIAAQTRAELEEWSLVRDWGPRRRSELQLFLSGYALASADESVCLRWAEVRAQAHRTGRPISVADAWVAATALAYAVPLITHNPDDFENVPGLTVITEK